MSSSFMLLQHVPWVGHICLTFGNVWRPKGPWIRVRLIFAVLRRIDRGLRFRWVAREERGRGGNVHAHVLVADTPCFNVIDACRWYRKKFGLVAHWTLVSRVPRSVGYVLGKLELNRFGGSQADRIWMSKLLTSVREDSSNARGL